MGGFSVFRQFGNGFRFSRRQSRGEAIYNAIVAAESPAFDLTPGTYEEARVFATAMGLARARYALERAQNQENPLKCKELLPLKEQDYGVVPREIDGIVARQRALATAMLLAKGSRRSAIEAGLRSILGNDFVALRTLIPSEVVRDESVANFARVDLPFKLVRFISPVATTETPVTVDYENADLTAAPLQLVDGDVLMVQPDNTGIREVVTVSGADASSFVATFTNSHDIGALATTQNWVGWTSTQRSFIVVVSAVASVDPEKRRQVDEFMAKVSRGPTAWSIVKPT